MSLYSVGKYLSPFQRKLLEKNLQEDLPRKYRQRLEIMLLADEGKSQGEICRTLGCSPTMARHWRLMASTGLAHNWRADLIGAPKRVNERYLERLRQLVSLPPKLVKVPNKPYTYPNGRWTAHQLSRHLKEELGIEVSDRHINRLLKQMGLSTRPQTLPTQNKGKNRIVIANLEQLPRTMWSNDSVSISFPSTV